MPEQIHCLLPRLPLATRWRGVFLAASMLLWGMPTTAGAETLSVRISFPASNLQLTPHALYTDVSLPDCEILTRVGAPALPCRAEQVVLPGGMRASKVTAVSLTSVRIPCGTVAPTQQPAILGPSDGSIPPPAPAEPDPAVYASSAVYPSDLAVLRGTGHFGDLTLASCEVHPVQYDPTVGELILHTEVELLFSLEPDPTARVPGLPQREMSRITTQIAHQYGMHESANRNNKRFEGYAETIDPDYYQYIIITTDDQVSAYETYAAWKTAKGVPATVVTVSHIQSNYPGRDLAERIRNFIIEAVATWGSSYVLLAGDQEFVPSRVCWAFDSEAGSYDDENDLYADLYFADLDGSWDDNGNDIFGEVDDNVDLYPDLMVGRAPTDDSDQAQAVVQKFLTYERTVPAGKAMDAFFFAEILWSDPYTDSGTGKNMMADLHFGPEYEPIERQYQSAGNESAESVIDYLNTGPHLANHAGHAFWSRLGCGNGNFTYHDALALHNAPHFFVLFSIGCWAGAFDYTCVGERLIRNGNGGAIAFIGNSRWGWGSPGNPGYGYSETFDRDFFGAILSEGITQFGPAVAWPKVIRIPFSHSENVYRWHQYQVNLLGDPEMACHTAEIQEMLLQAPVNIPLGTAQFVATVSDANGPIANARICLAGNDIYQVGFSDATGQVIFTPIMSGAQQLALTATAANHPAVEHTIIVAGNDPFLVATHTFINDDDIPPSAGNGNGEIGAGETIELYVIIHNYGGSDCNGVTGILSETSPFTSISVPTASFGNIPREANGSNFTPFVFTVSANCPPDHTIPFTLRLEDRTGVRWDVPLPLREVAPDLRFHHYVANEIFGDGDGIIDPSETVALSVFVLNEGSGSSGPLTAILQTSDPNLAVIQRVAITNSDLAPDGYVVLQPPFEVRIASWCPETTYGELRLTLIHPAGSVEETFLLAVGEAGFYDDTESGEGGWTHSGTNDMWHLDPNRQHSGNTSWYCGTVAYQYVDNTNASLVSPAFVVPEAAQLSFWCYYDVTIYGTDGIYVEVWQDGSWEILDYFGSGGALPGSLFICDWTEYTYALDDLIPGSTTQVRFRFETDDTDTAEGFYFDDISIGSILLPPVTVPSSQSLLRLSPTWPNPSGRQTHWQLSLPTSTPVTANIYDLRGRLVRRIQAGQLSAGDHVLQWDGRATSGAKTPAGIYLLFLRAGKEEMVRKVVKVDD